MYVFVQKKRTNEREIRFDFLDVEVGAGRLFATKQFLCAYTLLTFIFYGHYVNDYHIFNQFKSLFHLILYWSMIHIYLKGVSIFGIKVMSQIWVTKLE